MFATKISTFAHKAESVCKLRCIPTNLGKARLARRKKTKQNKTAAADVTQLGCYFLDTLKSVAITDFYRENSFYFECNSIIA